MMSKGRTEEDAKGIIDEVVRTMESYFKTVDLFGKRKPLSKIEKYQRVCHFLYIDSLGRRERIPADTYLGKILSLIEEQGLNKDN